VATPSRSPVWRDAWLLKRLIRIAVLLVAPVSAALALAGDWDRINLFLNGAWPPWVSNVANVVQIGSPVVALLTMWLIRAARSRTTVPDEGVAARLLGLLALLLPARDRERFVGEVLANMAGLRWRQRVGELLSVAAAVPGLAVIVRWARRRGG
jgi:hypothetical protein